MATGGLFPGVKKQGRKSDHSPPSGAEVKNEMSWISRGSKREEEQEQISDEKLGTNELNWIQ